MNTEFISAAKLQQKVNSYFNSLKNPAPVTDEKTAKIKSSKETLPATLSGLMLHLGFNSRKEYDDYETNGEFALVLKRARLRIEAAYEEKLHYQSSTGAIFALKNLGWNDKDANEDNDNSPATLHIEIANTSYKPASSENEVQL